MHTSSLKELAAGLKARRFSSRELTQHYLGRIERLDPGLNSYITVTAERALKQADAADALACAITHAHKRKMQTLKRSLA